MDISGALREKELQQVAFLNAKWYGRIRNLSGAG